MSISVGGQIMSLENLVEKAGDMKVFPAVARKVMEMVDRDDVSGTLLAEAISKDQALSAHLLKAANSALYGLPREITTILMAVSVLGFRNIRDMTIMATTRGVYKRFGITEKMLWTHSVSAAIGAKMIATKYARLVSDDAFICGLLHDVGKVILNNECPEAFSQVMMKTYNEGASSVQAELDVFGYTHTEVGSSVTTSWNYPKLIPTLILQHHRDEEKRPRMEDSSTLKVLACVDLANYICKILGAGYRKPNPEIDLKERPAFTYLDIQSETAPALVEGIQEVFSRETNKWSN